MSQKRAILLVLDSVGCGELPDAADFGDVGAHTLGHVAEAVEDFDMPHTRALGLGNIEGIPQLEPHPDPQACWGKMTEVSPGKDTTTGHWEFMGMMLEEPFRTFPDGFGPEILDPFCEAIGVDRVLANRPVSGTVIIEELGREHEATGLPIVYTSADPVFQIAAHEDIVPIETLYEWCQIAYEIVTPEGVSRVIARPFLGDWPDYERTHRRKDFAVPPPGPTALDALADAGVHVTGVGKISNIYSGQGIHEALHTRDNADGMATTLRCVREGEPGLLFTNLVDFDSKFGHRRNPQGYGEALMAFDAWLPSLLEELETGDLLIITADHGNDPTFHGTDHTREYAPLMALVAGGPTGRELGVRASFADVGATLAEFFGADWDVGRSFLSTLTD